MLPGVERVVAGDDVGAVAAHQHPDALVEGADLLGRRQALLDDLQRVLGAAAQRAVLTGALDAAVGVHAVGQAIWRGAEFRVQSSEGVCVRVWGEL